MAARILEVILRAKDQASAVIGKAEGNIASSTSKIGGLVKGLAATAAAAAVGKFFADSAKSAMDAERSMAGLSAALQPLGINYASVKASTEAYLTTLQRTTRFGDDEYRDTLSRMVAVTGDFNGSLKMLPTVAGIAINRQMDLASASDLVSKAMNGNTTALKKLGIEIPPGADALEILRQKFEQIATEDGETFSARLAQLKNGWDDFKEAVGNAIIGSQDMTDAAGGLVGILARLADFVQENQEFISSFIGVVFALGEAVWSIVRLPLKALVTALLMVNDAVSFVMFAFGSLVEKGGALLSKFGIDVVENMGASLREAGEAMARLSKTGYDALWGETTKGEARVTDTVAAGADARTRISKDEAAARLKAEKDIQKERAKIAEDIAVYALAIEQGLTEKQAREQVRRQQMLGTYVAVEFSTLERGYERRDALQQKYEQGWTRHLQRVIDASTAASAKVVDSTTRMIDPYKALDAQLSDIAKVGQQAKDRLAALAGTQEEVRQKTRDATEALEDGARGAIGLAQGIGLIGDSAAASLQNVTSLGSSLANLLEGGLSAQGLAGAITSLVGSAVSLIKGIFGESPEEKVRKQLLRDNTSAIKALTQATGDLAKVSAPGSEVARIRDFLGGLFGPQGQYTKGSYTAGKMRAGITDADIEKLAGELGITVRNSKSGKIESGALFQLFQALQGLDAGFSNTYAGQLDRLTKGLSLGAITKGQEFGQLLEAINAGGPNAISRALAGADFSSMEGRTSAAGVLRGLFTNIGSLKAQDLGGLNQGEFLDALQRLVDILTDPERAIDAIGGAAGAASGLDLSTAFGDLTVSFEDIGTQQIDYLASIDTGITGLLERWTDIDTGRIVQAPITITVGEVTVQTAATDAAGTGEAVQAAVTAAINQALADAYLDRQLATGNVTRTVT